MLEKQKEIYARLEHSMRKALQDKDWADLLAIKKEYAHTLAQLGIGDFEEGVYPENLPPVRKTGVDDVVHIQAIMGYQLTSKVLFVASLSNPPDFDYCTTEDTTLLDYVNDKTTYADILWQTYREIPNVGTRGMIPPIFTYMTKNLE